MIVLGINAYHSNASAALLVDGELVAAVEEERFTRQKYEVAFPHGSIRYCLDAAGIEARDIDHVAVSGRPQANLFRKLGFAVRTSAGRRQAPRRGDLLALYRAKGTMAEGLGIDSRSVRAKLHLVEHHLAHLGSAFYPSPFDRAAVLSLDGIGDMVSAMWGVGEGSRLRIQGEVNFPHSLGWFYLGFTQYLGFHKHGDEYKVMGLSAYGEPEYMAEMRRVISMSDPMHFALDMTCFRHLKEIQPIAWRGGTPTEPRIWDEGMARLFGPPRTDPSEPLDDRHRNVAASMQRRLEEVVLQMLGDLHRTTEADAVCLAGGVALNCVANGRVRASTGFRDVFVQPAAHDGGTSLGAAAYVHHQVLGGKRTYVMDHAYLGPDFTEASCRVALESRGVPYTEMDGDRLVATAAGDLADGRVVGWFQGRMEFGPRALGNRSILADPRRPEMKEVLNSRIKHREPFRPFAPSILEDQTGRFFEDAYPSPFMLMAYPVRRDKRSEIPAPTHIDGTGRVQTVRPSQNRLYAELLEAFGRRTGVPVLLNTSFNENEPICCTPQEAVDTFRRTRMDVLALGNLYARKVETPATPSRP
ncbi:MAG: carbamoyltransferase [Actinobacteria bacterium]|nr:MAG: carbamoyltransferase [Actinomycetota bacterium]